MLLLWPTQVNVYALAYFDIEAKIGSFLSFILVKFLGQTLQCTENVNLLKILPIKIMKKTPSKVAKM